MPPDSFVVVAWGRCEQEPDKIELARRGEGEEEDDDEDGDGEGEGEEEEEEDEGMEEESFNRGGGVGSSTNSKSLISSQTFVSIFLILIELV